MNTKNDTSAEHQSVSRHSVATPRAARSPKLALKEKRWGIIVATLVLGFIIGLLALGAATQLSGPANDKYQAVFLTDGKIFFGKLKNVNGSYLLLEKVFYTQNANLPSNATVEQKTAVANNVSLVRMGDEVYGPEGAMRIKSEQVLFWQNLKSDSKVAKAIDNAK